MIWLSIALRVKWCGCRVIWNSSDLVVIWIESQIRLSTDLKFKWFVVVNWFEGQMIWMATDLRFKWFGCQLIWESSDSVSQMIPRATDLKSKWFVCQLIRDWNDLVVDWSEIQMAWLSIDSKFKWIDCPLMLQSNDVRCKWVAVQMFIRYSFARKCVFPFASLCDWLTDRVTNRPSALTASRAFFFRLVASRCGRAVMENCGRSVETRPSFTTYIMFLVAKDNREPFSPWRGAAPDQKVLRLRIWQILGPETDSTTLWNKYIQVHSISGTDAFWRQDEDFVAGWQRSHRKVPSSDVFRYLFPCLCLAIFCFDNRRCNYRSAQPMEFPS